MKSIVAELPVMDKYRKKALKRYIRTLPRSQMVYPDKLWDRFKYAFWRVYTPYHPFVRETVTGFGLLHQPKDTHRYFLGRVSFHELEDFIVHLTKSGLGRHHVAWREKGEVVSLRLVKDFAYQYHVRIFENGEVYGHYEYTPECFPLSHLRKAYIEDKRHEFGHLFQDWIS